MASSEKDSNRLPQTPEDLQEAQRTAERVRLMLSEFARTNCAGKAADALCLFLQVHSCIFDNISTSQFPHMVTLNPLFASRFLRVCEDVFGSGGFRETPRLWANALLFYYENRPQHVSRSLALMAEAHILEDLPLSLYELEHKTGIQIDETQYQGALDDIIDCLKQLDKRLVKEVKSAEDWLISSLALHFAVAEKIRSLRIYQLRRAAWDEYQLRRSLALAQARSRKEPPSAPS